VDWLVAGLGNPGPKYEATRHNVGRDAVRRVAERLAVRLDASKFDALYGMGRLDGAKVGLAVALRYMNESGRALVPLAAFFKVPPERFLVIYDDLDLPLGSVRIRQAGGSGGNRGAESVLRSLGTEEFPRIRIGIGRPPPGWDAADYVLSRFRDDERAVIEEALDRAADAALHAVREGIEASMNAFN
jgi:PTH1 family peptidyl-tRNA hydrolase